MTNAPDVLQFHSDAVPDDAFLVSLVEGAESISGLYRFELELASKKPDIDLASVLQRPAWLGMKAPVRMSGSESGWRLIKVSGMIHTVRQMEQVHDWTRYRAVLVPRLWRLTIDRMTRIFIDKTVSDIIEEILKEGGFGSKDYELKCAAGPKREFVMQYQESDLDFISRWLEHEGIFYYFEQTDEGEKIVFADSTAGYVPIQGESKVRYSPAVSRGAAVGAESESAWSREELVLSLRADQSVIPSKVVLKDYNWRRPSTDLEVDADIVGEGVGTVYYYADHYKDEGEGKQLARVRAEEHKCRQRLFSGESDKRSFRAGSTFTLFDHYRSAFNAEYLLTEIRHRASQELGLPFSGATGATYRNEFTAIPSSETFRPERKTPWPSIHGIMHARVDAAGSGQYAEIDDLGRYKVTLPFDLSGRKSGTASRYVRMAQPYAGGGMGMHFPLHKDTEVLLAFLDGDPDRPIIVGAVPNPETGSPVTGANQTQCAIQTGGGNRMVFEDGDGSQRITLTTPSAGTMFSLGAPFNPETLGAYLETAGDFISKVTKDVGMYITGCEEREIKTDAREQVHGKKVIFIGGQKFETVVGHETKTIVGKETKTNIGMKNEIRCAVGIKIAVGTDFLIGKAKEVKVVPAVKKKYGQVSEWVGERKDNVVNWTTETAGKLKQIAADTSDRFGKWKTEVAGPWVAKAAQTTVDTASAKWKVGSDWVREAGGKIKDKASEWKADVSKATVEAGSTIKLKAGGMVAKIQGGFAKIGKLKIFK